jgi:2-methylcitrate dehydratase PrpD
VHAGITGASLAKAGFKGFRKIIEHPEGFSSAIFERYDLEEMVKDLGSDWRTDTHSPKLYPCCGWLDALIDSALDIMREHSVDWQEISSVQVQSPTVTLLLNKPKDELIDLINQIAAQEYLTVVPLFFNSVYPLAAAIVDGQLTAAQFTRERITDKKLQGFFDRIHFAVDPSLDVKEMQEGINSGGVKITLKDGTEYHKFTDAMRGSYKNPIDIRLKLEVCTRGIKSNQWRQEVYDAGMKLDSMPGIRYFCKLLA